jgi:hypothetical protein
MNANRSVYHSAAMGSLALALMAVSLSTGAAKAQTPDQAANQTRKTDMAQAKQDESADKAQAKADKAQAKADKTKQAKKAAKAQDKADDKAAKAGYPQE